MRLMSFALINGHKIPLRRYKKMVENEELCITRGYEYDNENGDNYVELHIDEHPILQDECNHLPFGGHLSVQKRRKTSNVTGSGQMYIQTVLSYQ
jgi:hypothetical protein